MFNVTVKVRLYVEGVYGAETNCEIARILGILLMNSCDT